LSGIHGAAHARLRIGEFRSLAAVLMQRPD